MTEPAIEGPDAVMESTASTPIASQSLDSAAIEQFEDEKPAKGKKKPKNPKGRHSESAVGSELKKLGQRRINVAGAPKMPLNGYVRFMNDRREELRREQPQRTALEHTRIIGEEWHQLPEERKVPYMEAAAKDKAIYQEQLQMFLQEHPEIVAKELAKAKKVTKLESSAKEKTPKTEASSAKTKKPKAKQVKRQSEDPDDVPLAKVKRAQTPPPPEASAAPAPPPPPPQQPPAVQPAPMNVAPPAPRPLQPGEIPIYTNEFIEHNRSTENELRTLRKAKTDLEQQNAVLEQHVDNTKAGYAKVMGEVTELMEENRRLETYVRGLRQKLVAALGGISLPPLEPSGPSVGNIDKYIRHLAGLVGQPNNVTLLKAREALRKLDTSSLLKP
ncbi:SWI/SNF-related matrix-associated actin-dependent regulator of chromatin subfamily E member 1-related [Drosophila elegans]|uniref:SWI/SNF-related matrix-associated actin-dependent regulator of chromatin subfamily E member 1-related n=1 Tax=Drosophila elegans TaxID=30023 RepID=UPI0007E85AD0|nr:SWI/SNF-related matrix-associated actin-dependent regulator of chromatin subfamily E member 1-related [Drosophila elegans]